MTPAARVQAAIEILDRWLSGGEGVDRFMARWGRENRFAGSGDRRAIADLVYDALRCKRRAAWVAGSEDAATGRDLLRGSLVLAGADLDTIFSGDRHAPAPLTGPERTTSTLDDAPRAVLLDLPDWLVPMFDAYPDGVALALKNRAPLDLRVNLLKTDPSAAAAALVGEGIATAPVSLSDTALRVTEGARKVAQSAAYRDGLVEIQDAASQAVVDMTEPRSGETVLDLCAGAGGKTLALAARMGGRGRFLVHDIAPARLVDLGPRAKRAGITVETIATDGLGKLAGTIDHVIVDAPCSGSGAWRRNPDAKWRLTPAELERLCAVQASLLDQALDLVTPNGRISYMTCSLLATENGAQCVEAIRRHPGLDLTKSRQFTPIDGADGFFCGTFEYNQQG